MRLKAVYLVAAMVGASACSTKADRQTVADKSLGQLSNHIAELNAKLTPDSSPAQVAQVVQLEEKLQSKRHDRGLAIANNRIMQNAMSGHTKIYPLAGKYKVLVVPVQFADVKFTNPSFYTEDKTGTIPAQDYLFGSHQDSMTSFYRHESQGQLDVSGEIAPMITVDGNLVDYGEATAQGNDKNARGLVVQTLKKLLDQRPDPNWWANFDRWDLQDYDSDHNYYEADGFIDAVILIYAGKDQASCQRSFDPTGARPASADVPDGPRHNASVECFNRIWPHRWSISIAKDDPLYNEAGPSVEGFDRPAFNGLKINEELFALDYNMQSEFSDRSTFFHEFGHSLSLPDVYASSSENSTGSWELMSNNANLQGQEFSSYSRMSLGWLHPKIVVQGQNTSAYLGSNNFVTAPQRNQSPSFDGPILSTEPFLDEIHDYDIVSIVPETGEPVYRSVMSITEPTKELTKVINIDPAVHGHLSAYSGRFDGNTKSLKVTLKVPDVDNPVVSFDTLYQVETETNFDSKDEVIKVVTDYDLGSILIGGKTVEELRTISGDANADTIAEINPACDAVRVLELRTKGLTTDLSVDEAKEFKSKKALCQAPIWVKKSFDLTEFRAKEVDLEIRYTTDAGYTELGIVVDNIQLDDTKFDFENGSGLGDFKQLLDGKEEAQYQQFYLFEHRNVGENYVDSNGQAASWNMDNHINLGGQSFFLEGSGTPLERYRMVKMNYQPGVLVWYFNSKFTRQQNNTPLQNGKGYLLVVNSDPKEVLLPGIFSEARWLNEKNEYRVDEDSFKTFVADQAKQFVCLSYTAYAEYITGEAPVCDAQFKDALQTVTLNGKPLRYRREWFNEILPINRYSYQDVGEPFRTDAAMRTGFSTFRPKTAAPYRPFTVYKVEDGKMVVDTEMTAASTLIPAKDSFADKAQVATSKRFEGDTVMVEKKNFAFKVVDPSRRVTAQYSAESEPSSNDNAYRRPLAKVYLNWN